MPRAPRLRVSAAVAALLICSFGVSETARSAEPKLPLAAPADVGMQASRLEAIDRIVAEGIRDKKMPGCVIVVGHKGKIVHRKAYGLRRAEPSREEMTLDTVFDLASLTKPISTATSVHKLASEGKIDLDAPVTKYLPAFVENGKDKITVRHLLLHTSGLIPDNAISDYALGPDTAWQKILALKPVAGLEEKFMYSDVNFLVLGRIVEEVSGRKLNEYVRAELYEPLGMSDTGYLPDQSLLPRICPTEKKGETWLTGLVHDPRAQALGGVAGHAGLFSTGDDLAVFAQMLLNGGTWNGKTILPEAALKEMTRPTAVPGSNFRMAGWDNRSGYSSNRGDLLSPAAYGHGGFTGTGIWIDPEQDLFVIFLSSRLHPTGEGIVNPLIGRVCTVAAAAIQTGKP